MPVQPEATSATLEAMDADVVVIGAGVVGLAVASELAERGRDVLVLERHDAIGTETSSRNSEVIHAGIYYPEGSLKARWCVEGKALLYDFCARYGVPHRRIGKVIVAVAEDEEPVLAGYARAARANGVGELQPLDRAQVRRLEPAVHAVSGLWSESTGIIDSHAYMLALQGRLEAHGGMLAFNAPVLSGTADGAGVTLEVAGESPMRVRARWVVNSAGLAAPDLARAIATPLAPALPVASYAVGHYYTYSGRGPFNHLVYPMAVAGGLGVHVTLDLAGGARFGPDVRWQATPDYRFDDSQREAFVAAILRYFPGLDRARLQPGYTGIRPKINNASEPAADFMLLPPAASGAPLVHLFGIESPGLTSSLAIARAVAALVADD
jgi:D-amino-acid oxidase